MVLQLAGARRRLGVAASSKPVSRAPSALPHHLPAHLTPLLPPQWDPPALAYAFHTSFVDCSDGGVVRATGEAPAGGSLTATRGCRLLTSRTQRGVARRPWSEQSLSLHAQANSARPATCALPPQPASWTCRGAAARRPSWRRGRASSWTSS